MPITESAKKALRQNLRRRMKNVKQKADLKTAIKKYRKLILAGKKDEAKNYLSAVYKKLDKSAKARVIAKNKASRLKSRLTKILK